MKKCSILVVEDEALIAANLVQTLTSLEYTVHKPVAKGEDAIHAVKTDQPDLVLMDIQLIGKMNGIEAAEKIRAIADIPIVYLTAYTDDLRLKQAQLTEPYGFIVKPAHSRELHATIEMALYKHGLDRKLKGSEERNRSIVEALPGIIFQFSADGRFIDCQFNKGDLLLLPPDQMIGKQVAEILPPDLAHLTERKIRETLDSGHLQTFEYSLTLKDQKHFFEARMITSGTDSVLAFIYDITEHKVAEEALRGSETKHRALFEAIADSVFLIDQKSGNILDVNPAASRQYGFSHDEFVLMNAVDVSAEPEQTVIAIERPVSNIPLRYHHRKDGSIFPVELTASTFELQGKTIIIATARDITERKRDEEILRESEARFRKILEMAPLPLCYVNVNGVITLRNERFVQIFGYTADDVPTLVEWWQQAYPDAHYRQWVTTTWDAAVKRATEDGIDIKPVEYTVTCKSGEERIIEISGITLGDDFLATFIDLTERKRAEEALRESEERLRTIILSMQFGIVIIDAQTHTILEANDKALEMIGGTSESVAGSVCHRFICPAELGKCPVTDLGQNIDSSERVLLTMRGEKIPILKSVIRITLGGKDVLIESFIDITERKRAEAALKESEERYRNVVEDQTEFICRFLPDGTHVFVNDAYCRYFNKKREELIGHRFRPRLHPDDRENVAQHIASITPEHPVIDIDQRIMMPDGSTRWQRWSDRAIFDQNGRVVEYQSVGRDITKQKVAEEALALASKKLALLSGITRHDINNQMTVLQGYLTILKKKQPDPALTEYFQKVSTAAQRISSMIQFTREYEKIGVNAPIWQDCRTLTDTAAKEAPLGKIMVKNDLPAGSEVFADPLIVKVFYNLMDNAVRYGGKITTIRFSVEEAGDDHRIVCEDDGDGIVAGEKEKIFDKGFGKNTGLGLALSREILDITGITIRETGEPGKGARFEMTVPKGAWRIVGHESPLPKNR